MRARRRSRRRSRRVQRSPSLGQRRCCDAWSVRPSDAHSASVALRGCNAVLAGCGGTTSAMWARRRLRRRSRRVRRSPRSSKRRRCTAWSVCPTTLTAQVSPCVVAVSLWQAGGQQDRRCGRAGARGSAPVVFGAHHALVGDGAVMLERASHDAHGKVSPCAVATPFWQARGQQDRRCGRAGARGGAPVVFGAHHARVSDGAALL